MVPLSEFIASASTDGDQSWRSWFKASPHLSLRSTAHSIHLNLAAEEAMMRGVTLQKGERLLFLYCNDPCVVVGRNQNLYAEVSLRRAARDGVTVARRSSGGGAVYQDRGNLCLSFFSHRADYAPEKSIQILRHGLCALYDVAAERLTTTKRYDLFLDGCKITGSAMRVQRDLAFHHCTLLVDTALERVGRYLHGEGDYVSFHSSSVGSVRSPVTSMAAKGLAQPPTTPAGGDRESAAVAHAEDFLSHFFCRYGPFIAQHEAPWALSLEEVLRRPYRGSGDTASTAVAPVPLVLDVAGASAASPTLSRLAEEERSVFEAEATRIATVDWQFNMPPFTTVVSVRASELMAEEECPPCGLSGTAVLFAGVASAAAAAAAASAALLVETTVQDRRVTSVAVALTADDRAAGSGLGAERPLPLAARTDVTAVPWLQAFLRAVLVGSYCDTPPNVLVPPSGDDRAALLCGLAMELSTSDEALSIAEGIPETLRWECVLRAVHAVLCEWRRKNVFDVSLVGVLGGAGASGSRAIH